jgi:hypothetical protein
MQIVKHPIETLENLIIVRPPYFALKNVYYDEEEFFYAEPDNEYLYKYEGGPMAAAEFGRHLAILGSVALAKKYSIREANYYLATKAFIKRNDTRVYSSDQLKLSLSYQHLENKKASVTGRLTDDHGMTVFEGSVEYLIMSQNVFGRLYSQYKVDQVTSGEDHPYKYRKAFRQRIYAGETAIGRYGIIKPEHCEGHFQHFPALPVAIVGNLFSQLSIDLMRKITGLKNHKFVLTDSMINSYNLAFHGEKAIVHAKLVKSFSPTQAIIHCEATTEKGKFADAQIELEAVA